MNSPDNGTPYGYSRAAHVIQGSGRSGLAMAALIIAIVAVIISTGVSVAQFTLIGWSLTAVKLAAALAPIANASAAIVALVALVLGIFAVRGSRPAVAGAAIGIAAAHVTGTAVTMLASRVMF